MSNSKTFDEILFVVFVARKWKCKISRHGYDYHCSHARHGHHCHRDRQENQEIQDRQIWHLNLTIQVTCVGQLSQFLRCFIFIRTEDWLQDCWERRKKKLDERNNWEKCNDQYWVAISLPDKLKDTHRRNILPFCSRYWGPFWKQNSIFGIYQTACSW